MPGMDKLPTERELMEQFQVSRVAIREALRTLENSGFVSTRQGATGGTYVIELSFENLSSAFIDLFLAEKISIPEMFHVRVLIEPEVARLAAMRITPESTEKLLEILEKEESPVNSLADDIETKTMAHFVLAEICGNRFLEALVKSLMRVTKKVIEAVNPNTLSMHPAGMHRPIVEAVIAGKPNEAAEAMRRHALEFGEVMIEMERAHRESLRSGFNMKNSVG
ncbi:MAG: GntR family transcriptional regulator, transcriptional repressor for pyruvate dehydrogenase complex [Thermodesulfobacteriota bacterium]|nr:GntR family transcriptional regulator, transcriptional repressor for pyruvate dehydrogenase complex [Thermodesulfobacteriota bacterium]